MRFACWYHKNGAFGGVRSLNFNDESMQMIISRLLTEIKATR
jgi:hypothetical protein